MSRWILVFLCFVSFGLEAKPKKHNLAVCALFKNESENLREWIEYHKMIGVDHFYLYDNGSKDQYMKVLRPYINQRMVTLVRWPDLLKKEEGENLFKWVLSTQIPAYENALIVHAKKEAKWIAFLDVDEFLLPVKADSLAGLLEKYEGEPGIAIVSDCFDASLERASLLKTLVIETEDLTKEPEKDARESVRKVIFKPELYAGSTWAPYECRFAGDKQAVEIDEKSLRVNRYIGRNSVSLKPRRKLYIEKDAEKKEVLDAGYDMQDQRKSIHRFLPELSRRMSMQP